MSFSIRMSDYERRLFSDYAKFNGLSIGDALKKALMEKIEDEYDIATIEEIEAERKRTGEETRPIQELWDELGL